MTEDSQPQPSEVFATDRPSPAPDPWRAPASLWVWLVLLLATFAVPQISDWEGRGAKIAKQSTAGAAPTASMPELLQAEYLTRLALSPIFSGQSTQGALSGGNAKSLADAATDAYRTIAVEKKGVLAARKVLVLEHLQKKPLDNAFLTGVLASNLSGRGEKAGPIGSEIALWRSLYGKNAARDFDRANTDLAVKRVRALDLGLLEKQALTDVYRLAGRDADADRTRKSLQDKITSDVTRLILVILLLGVGALAGIAFLVLFAVAWAGKKWNLVGRIRREPVAVFAKVDLPSALPFGSLLDVFVAYLALSRGMGLIAGIIPGLESVSDVYLSAGVYVGSGGIAALYGLSRARAERWDLPRLGMRTAGLRDVLYGVAGYCAALPVLFTLAALNNAFFKKTESALAPNPVLPMIAGEGSEIGRVVLFCLVAIAAPIVEELFFRGVLYSALKARFSTALAVILSAACFAVAHPMGDWLPIFGLGCVLATVRELRQSLIPGIVLHFLQNAVAFTMMSSLFGK